MLNRFSLQSRKASCLRLALASLAACLGVAPLASFAQISPGVPPAVNDGYYAPMIIQQQAPAQPAGAGSVPASTGPDNPPPTAPAQTTGAPPQTIMVPITIVPQVQTQQSAPSGASQ